jgi:hypothetical protein
VQIQQAMQVDVRIPKQGLREAFLGVYDQMPIFVSSSVTGGYHKEAPFRLPK